MKTLLFRCALVLVALPYLASVLLACWPTATPPDLEEYLYAERSKVQEAVDYRQRFASALVAFDPEHAEHLKAVALLQKMNDPSAGNTCDSQRVGDWKLGLVAHVFTHHEPEALDQNYAVVVLANWSADVIDVLMPKTDGARKFRSATLDDVDKDNQLELVVRFDGASGAELVVYRATEKGFEKVE